jgi:hypothetical protein
LNKATHGRPKDFDHKWTNKLQKRDLPTPHHVLAVEKSLVLHYPEILTSHDGDTLTAIAKHTFSSPKGTPTHWSEHGIKKGTWGRRLVVQQSWPDSRFLEV